jgi:ferric-dicitrate binding protein FerR (iron transport regulator)
VELEGEAFFEVSTDEKRPFIVKTKYLDIKVLGTSFNVQTINDTDETRIALIKGKVEIIEKNNSIKDIKSYILTPNQAISYNKKSGFINRVLNFNELEEIGWKDGVIYFKNANLNEVIKRLEKWYNVNIEVVKKPHFKWSYNGIFRDQSLQNVLESMGYSQEFDYVIEDKEVIIRFK